MLTRSLCIYPGYRRVVVLADITVETCCSSAGNFVLEMYSSILIDSSAERMVLEHVAYLQRFERVLHCQEPQQSPHFVSASAWKVNYYRGVQPHLQSSSYQGIPSTFE